MTEKQRNSTVVTNTYNSLNLLTNRSIQPAAGVPKGDSSTGYLAEPRYSAAILDTTGETYEYDGASRLTKGTDNDSTVEFTYDSLNRKIQETQNNKLIKYTYDKVNNLTSIQYPNQRIIEREFDLLNRISKIKQGGTDIANMAFIGRTYRMLSKGYQNGDIIKYLYDAGRRNTGIEAKNLNQQIINQYAYGYNKVNLKNYEQRIHDGNKGDVYAYDAVNRIKNVKFDALDPTDPQTAQFAKAKTYNLDKVDNILKIVENKNNVDAEILTEMSGNNAQMNQYTKFDQWTITYDQNGNTTQKGTQQFSYNYRNQLVRATSGANIFTLKYDPFGRRIEKSGAGNTIRFYYAGNQVIEERNGSDAVLKQYVWGNGIDELLRMDKYSGNTPTPYYFHTNDIGSTTAITDGTGALVERASYDTFGLPSFTDASGQAIAASTIGNAILFQGRELDTELNLYNYRARYYDPIMGRFLQTDPVGYQDSMNLYQGMNMNPGNFVDPWGEWTLGVHKKITEEAWEKYSGSGYPGLNMSDFKAGLIQGSTWPDVPNGYIEVIQSGVNWNLGISTFNLSYLSHYGALQSWHSMQSEGNTKESTREEAIGFISGWANLAKDSLTGDRSNKLSGLWKGFMPGHFLGMALHIIEDSYCPAHTERNKESWNIVEFHKYDKENRKTHTELDKLTSKTKYYFEKAIDTVKNVIELFFQNIKNPNSYKVMKAYMLKTIFEFEPAYEITWVTVF